jgi:hypothetical protein
LGHGWGIAGAGGSLLGLGSWQSLVILGLIALLLVLLVRTIRSNSSEPARSEVEREIHENMDGQVRSMLLQAGGSLTQDRIRENLGVVSLDLARELDAMEKRGEVRREWLPLEYTYRIYLADVSPVSPVTNGAPSAQPSS